MAVSNVKKHTHPGRRLVVFGLVIVFLYGLMALSKTWTPRLGLDLRGGTTITLTAANTSDGKAPSKATLETARSIIQKRVDSLGVGESAITVQGDRQIEVAVPNTSSDELVSLVGTTAQLGFRRVYAVAQATPDPQQSKDPTAVTTALPTAPPENPTPHTAEMDPVATDFDSALDWTPTDKDKNEFAAWNCGDGDNTLPNQPLFACDEQGSAKYLLGPELISGQRVTDSNAGIPQQQLTWEVSLKFDGQGAQEFEKTTAKLTTLQSPNNMLGIVLDGKVVSSPGVNNGAIADGSASISGGNINEESARELANQLKYGALPVNFTPSSVDTVSASLGDEQLQAGLIAGIIGLALVVAYSFFYYRGLGVVVIGSLCAAVLITWGTIVLLGGTVGFAMNLPGIAGAIVAIGITADSFIVYFERIRDEIRDGHSLRHSIQSGWFKARGTIVMADAVQLLSAVVLFVLAIGAVKGFAFTLGVTTAIDLFIVFFFTHPLVTLLGRTEFFGRGHRFSGFEPEHLGVSRASLIGRGRLRNQTAKAAKSKQVNNEATTVASASSVDQATSGSKEN